MQTDLEITTFEEFWPKYLSAHSKLVNRIFHFIGTLGAHLLLIYSLVSQNFSLLLAVPVFGYGFAWAGHFVFEKNKPTTLTHFLYSLRGDLKMFYLMCFGKLWKKA